MDESLEQFLKKEKPNNTIPATGSFVCQECPEVCNNAVLDEDYVLTWTCSRGHVSKVAI